MSCSNCYNGCTQITSDKCVKYTGVDISVLGIKNGDSLSFIQQALIEFLVSTLDGSGIVLDIDSELICDLISGYLPECRDLTLADLSSALVQSICSLKTSVESIEESLAIKEADYTINCLANVSAGDGTHVILQAVINLLCTAVQDITAVENDLAANYVPIDEIDDYIATYNASVGTSALMRNKMIPYVAVEYYGSTSFFNATGAGTGDWEQIYLCNGLNGTPDKRGRVGVGATTGMGGSTLDTEVDPANAGNPVYALLTPGGTNTITLTVAQMPDHTHTPSISSDPGHTHTISDMPIWGSSAKPDSYDSNAGEVNRNTKTTATGGAHTHTIAIASKGGGLAHQNNQPALGCYYIIYIPS